MKHYNFPMKYWVTTNVSKNFIFLRMHTVCYVNTVSTIFNVDILIITLDFNVL